jgi:hypothetical protein
MKRLLLGLVLAISVAASLALAAGNAVCVVGTTLTNFPTGTVAGPWHFDIAGPVTPAAQTIVDPASGPIQATFSGLTPGAYTAHVWRLKSDGVTQLGLTVTGTAQVPDPGVNIPTATTLTITIN